MEYAWSKDNPDRWDPDETGILSGRQHQTLDMELFEPQLVARLDVRRRASRHGRDGRRDGRARPRRQMRSGSAMPAPPTSTTSSTTAAGSSRRSTSATRACSQRFDTGRSAGVLADSFMSAYWSDEHGEIKYQFGERLHRRPDPRPVARRGRRASAPSSTPTASPRRSRRCTPKTSAPTMAEHFNPCRNYAYEDEGGLLIATYPGASASRWSPRPMPRKSGPASSTPRPRT